MRKNPCTNPSWRKPLHWYTPWRIRAVRKEWRRQQAIVAAESSVVRTEAVARSYGVNTDEPEWWNKE